MATTIFLRRRKLTRTAPLFALCFLGWILLSATSSLSQDSPLHWQQQPAQVVPGHDAIAGGGSASPAYLCRARDGAGLYPGQWSSGSCAIARDGQAEAKSDYEIAYGQAAWSNYDPGLPGLLQTGNEADGSPLYSCRVQSRGYQVGVITDNKCSYAIDGRYVAQRPPFEALYAAGSAPIPAAVPQPVASPPKRSRDSLDDLAPSSATEGTNPGSNRSCLATAGKSKANRLVKQCLQVSTATHPPCNVDNSCSLIRDEIRRGCLGLGVHAPDFCDQYR